METPPEMKEMTLPNGSSQWKCTLCGRINSQVLDRCTSKSCRMSKRLFGVDINPEAEAIKANLAAGAEVATTEVAKIKLDGFISALLVVGFHRANPNYERDAKVDDLGRLVQLPDAMKEMLGERVPLVLLRKSVEWTAPRSSSCAPSSASASAACRCTRRRARRQRARSARRARTTPRCRRWRG